MTFTHKPTGAPAFLADRRACGHAHRCSPRALDPLLGFLRALGVAPPTTPAPIETATDRLLAEFENHLLANRGLSDRTVAGYRRVATVFLADRFSVGKAPQMRGFLVFF